jgi:hypothetical protein
MEATNYSTERIVVPNPSSIDDFFNSPVEIGMFVKINFSSRFVVDETNMDYKLIWYVKWTNSKVCTKNFTYYML